MPHRDEPFAPGTPCWADAMVRDLDAAKRFYGGLFGWTFDEPSEQLGDYVLARHRGHLVAGLGLQGEDRATGSPPAWTTYLATEDADATVQAAAAAGGAFFSEPVDVIDIARMAIGADPAGAAYGLWQAGRHPGAQLVDEPGSICWAESMSRDYQASRTFYREVFGYALQEIGADGFHYSVATLDGGPPIGGIGAIPDEASPDVPSHWMVYFSVDDCDAAAGRVTQLGGTVMQPPFDTRYGRAALVAGSQGEAFSVMRMSPPAHPVA